ncbi:MAG: hypothetical protein J6A52_02100 [Bacilli bacterium]|nr:hypothetical protein [Bacilli bacterium]
MKNKNFIIVCACLLVTIGLMAVGYTRLSGIVTVNSTATIAGKWNVAIVGIEEEKIVGDASSITPPTFTSSNASFNAKLGSRNSSIKYKVTVKNNGNITAKLNAFQFLPQPNENDVILFTSENAIVGEKLKPGEEKYFYITVKYNSSEVVESQNKQISAVYEFVQSD